MRAARESGARDREGKAMSSNLADEVAKSAAQTARTSGSVPVQVLSLAIQLIAAWRATKDNDYEKAAKSAADLNTIYKDDPVTGVCAKLGPIQTRQLEDLLKEEGIKCSPLARGLLGVHRSDLERARELAEGVGIKLPELKFSREQLEEAVPEALQMVKKAAEKAESLGSEAVGAAAKCVEKTVSQPVAVAAEAVKVSVKVVANDIAGRDGVNEPGVKVLSEWNPAEKAEAVGTIPGYPAEEPDEAEGGYSFSCGYLAGAAGRVAGAIAAGQAPELGGLEQKEPSR